jgi:ABC-2 type transport system permease protein
MLPTADHKVQIRFDRTREHGQQGGQSVMNQIEVSDFSLSEPDLGISSSRSTTAPWKGDAMIQTARQNLSAYTALFAMIPKLFMAYQIWFWIGLVLNIISMAILVFFWRAIYAETASISGLALDQTLQYILLAFIFMPLTSNDLVWEFGSNLREGMMIHHLLRPINFQGMNYAQSLGTLVTRLALQIPMVLWQSSCSACASRRPATWLAFLVSALLGYTVMFFFYWFLACLTFYTTEIWGLGVLIEGMNFFLSGSLVPLVMMPEWLRTIVLSYSLRAGAGRAGQPADRDHAPERSAQVWPSRSCGSSACGSFHPCSLKLPCARSRCRGLGIHDPLPEPLLATSSSSVLKVLMEYRASFILGASSTIVWQASSIAAVWVVMQKVPSLNGWNYDEVLLVYGLVTCPSRSTTCSPTTCGRWDASTSAPAASTASSSARSTRSSTCSPTASARTAWEFPGWRGAGRQVHVCAGHRLDSLRSC